MADFHHTLESSSAQENSSYIVNLIVQHVCASTPTGIGSLAHSVISSQYDPYIVLQGAWLRELGFEIGGQIKVLAVRNMLRVMPGSRFPEVNRMVKVDEKGRVSRIDFKEEVDGIKAEKGDKNRGELRSTDDCKKEGGKEGVRESAQDIATSIKNSTRSSTKNSEGKCAKSYVKDGAKREGSGDVLAGVKNELDYD